MNAFLNDLLATYDLDTWLKLLSGLGTAFAWLYARRQKPRLQWFFTHFGAHQVAGQGVNTHCLVVHNAGFAPAKNVRIIHAFVPIGTDIQLWPRMDYRINPLQPGGSEILIERLRPKEQVAVSYLYTGTTGDQFGTRVVFDDGTANHYPIQYTRIFPVWMQRMFLAWLLIGWAVTVYYVLKLFALVVLS